MASARHLDGPGPGCGLVFAHPDDEVLWASSVLAEAGKVILCYGDFPGKPVFSEQRRKALAQLPVPGLEALQIEEAAVAGTAAWPFPEEVDEGLAPRKLPFGLDAPLKQAYARNFTRLCQELETRLAGLSEVVTHNPWGEYGHEEHVQVFRAVQAVQARLGFRLWVTGYVGDRAMGLMQRNIDLMGPPTRPKPTDPDLSERLRRIYVESGCWTWPADYIWPEMEWFYPVKPIGEVSEQKSLPPVRGSHAVRSVRINLIETGWMPEADTVHLMRCVMRSLRVRAVRRLPRLGPLLERMDYVRGSRGRR